MVARVVTVEPLSDYRLAVTFADGETRLIGLRGLIWSKRRFAPLRDPAVFERACVDEKIHSVSWPNGIDLNPDTLYGLEERPGVVLLAADPTGSADAWGTRLPTPNWSKTSESKPQPAE